MYADVIIGSSLDKLDRPFTYRIPDNFPIGPDAITGCEVYVPFGRANRQVKGFVTDVKAHCDYAENAIKDLIAPVRGSVSIESRLITMAVWLRENYGGTMNDALHAVIPAPRKVRQIICHRAELAISTDKANALVTDFALKHYAAKERVLRKILEEGSVSFTNPIQTGTTMKVFKGLEEEGIIKLTVEKVYKDPAILLDSNAVDKCVQLNDEQHAAVDTFMKGHSATPGRYLLFGVTGSGKTEVYIAMMEQILKEGRQVIFLIPEIALTFQMIERLSAHFAGRIAMLNSRMSAGERYAQYLKAKEGLVDIVVGPRSALFTPFSKLGLIIVDEEHESSYKSEKSPRYHAREAAIYRAETEGADIVLGSATPSLEAMKMVSDGKMNLLRLMHRAGGAKRPSVYMVDLREELKAGNRSVISRKLSELIREKLAKQEQVMLFINRRGYAGFVNCRSCGHVMKCPHCDVSLTYHKPGRLICHYCGYEIPMPGACPSCGSKFIATFGLGTEKVEEFVKKEFPDARVLRMDADTTTGKNGHEEILSRFKDGDADILIGTQMIVKGHDFANVTLVGILAADLSLYTNDFRAAERTFDLCLQAAGRAGRGEKSGDVVIQTYHPEHYAVIAAAKGDYISFYNEEMRMRKLAGYPPAAHILAVIIYGNDEKETGDAAAAIKNSIDAAISGYSTEMKVLGPVWASIAKIRDVYRKVIYIKADDRTRLVRLKNIIERRAALGSGKTSLQFDFDPQGTVF